MPVSVIYEARHLHPDDLMGELISDCRFTGIINNHPIRRRAVPYYGIEMYADNNRTFRVYVKDGNLDIIDLTGATGVFTMKVTKQSTTPSVQKSTAVAGEGQIGAADEGEMFFFIVPADTSSLDIRQYVFDVSVTLANGKSYTVLEGTINLLQPVG
jgi:hypothetical protein